MSAGHRGFETAYHDPLEDAKGEKLVTRHILRKVTENENILLDGNKEVTELRNDLALLRADMPGIIANVVGALCRDRLGKIGSMQRLCQPLDFRGSPGSSQQ